MRPGASSETAMAVSPPIARHEDLAHGHVEEGFTGFRQPFIVFGDTLIAGEPRERFSTTQLRGKTWKPEGITGGC